MLRRVKPGVCFSLCFHLAQQDVLFYTVELKMFNFVKVYPPSLGCNKQKDQDQLHNASPNSNPSSPRYLKKILGSERFQKKYVLLLHQNFLDRGITVNQEFLPPSLYNQEQNLPTPPRKTIAYIHPPRNVQAQ